MENYFSPVLLTLAVLGLMVVARAAFGVISRLEGYSLTYEMVENDNPAVGIRCGLFLLAVLFSFLGILHPSGIGLAEDFNLLAGYGLLAIGLLVPTRWINDRFILYDFNNNSEVIGKKNSAVAIVEGATYLAAAFIVAGSLAGFEGGFRVALIWFGIGQFFLIALGLLYRLFVRGLGPAIEGHNIACAFSFGGFLLSGGIALGSAVSGPFTGWTRDIVDVAAYICCWLAFMLIVSFAVNYLILPGHRLRREIMNDRNIAAGIIEAVVFVSVTLFYVRVW